MLILDSILRDEESTKFNKVGFSHHKIGMITLVAIFFSSEDV